MKKHLKRLVSVLSLALIFFGFQSVSVFAKDLTVISVEQETLQSEYIISQDSILNATDGVVIPKLSIEAGVEIVEINADIKVLEVGTLNNVELKGIGNITDVIISTDKTVYVNTTGNINKLQITNSASRIVVKEGTKIAELRIPVGSKVTDIITNYEQAKNRFENIIGGESTQSNSPEITPPLASEPPVVGEEPVTPPVVERNQ